MEVSDFASRSQIEGAAVEFQVTVNDFQQGGFSLTVPTYNSDSVALPDFQRLFVEYRALKAIKGHGSVFDHQDVHASFIGCFQRENEVFTLFWHAGSERFQFLLHAFDHFVLCRN